MALFFAFSLFRFYEAPKNGVSLHPTPNEMNVKRCFKPTAQPAKN
jgi:hypothetical protein